MKKKIIVQYGYFYEDFQNDEITCVTLVEHEGERTLLSKKTYPSGLMDNIANFYIVTLKPAKKYKENNPGEYELVFKLPGWGPDPGETYVPKDEVLQTILKVEKYFSEPGCMNKLGLFCSERRIAIMAANLLRQQGYTCETGKDQINTIIKITKPTK